MMFEELFSRKKQSKTSERNLPREIDAIRQVSGGKKRSQHSSITVDRYLMLNRLVVGCVILIGLVIIGIVASGLVSDFIDYSPGAPAKSSAVSPSAEQPLD